MSDEFVEILEANLNFYRAFSSLRLDEMQAVWLRSPKIQCVHPGGTLLVGWDDVMKSWESIFSGTPRMDFELENQIVHAGTTLAMVCNHEVLTTEQNGRVVRGVVRATNVFTEYDGEWLMINHHAS